MKRVSVLLLLFVLVSTFSFVFAAEPEVVDPADVEKLKAGIDKIPIDEQGRIDEMKLEGVLGFGKTKAEGRIDKINLWLEDNAAWLVFVFRMQPAVSWIFALNIYFLLLFSVIFAFNGDKIWLFIENEFFARMFGSAFFLLLLLLNFYVNLSVGLFHIIIVFFTVVLPATLIWATIGLLVLLLILAVLAVYAQPTFYALARWLGKMAGKHLSKDVNEKIADKATAVQERLEQSAKEAEAYTEGMRK